MTCPAYIRNVLYSAKTDGRHARAVVLQMPLHEIMDHLPTLHEYRELLKEEGRDVDYWIPKFPRWCNPLIRIQPYFLEIPVPFLWSDVTDCKIRYDFITPFADTLRKLYQDTMVVDGRIIPRIMAIDANRLMVTKARPRVKTQQNSPTAARCFVPESTTPVQGNTARSCTLALRSPWHSDRDWTDRRLLTVSWKSWRQIIRVCSSCDVSISTGNYYHSLLNLFGICNEKKETAVV